MSSAYKLQTVEDKCDPKRAQIYLKTPFTS